MIPNNLVHRTGTRVGSLTQAPLSQAPRFQASSASSLFDAGDASSHLQSALEAIFGGKTAIVIQDLSRFIKHEKSILYVMMDRGLKRIRSISGALEFVDGPGGLRVQFGRQAKQHTVRHFAEVVFHFQQVWTPTQQQALIDAITKNNDLRLCKDNQTLPVYLATNLFHWIYSIDDGSQQNTNLCNKLWRELLGNRLSDRLSHAVEFNDVPACQRLLEPLARELRDQSAPGEGFRKHLQACLEKAWSKVTTIIFDEVAICQLFVEAGVDVNAKDKGGRTPLHWAVFLKNVERCRFLLAAGADMMACVEIQCEPIWFDALQEKHEELLQVFLEAAVDVNVKLVLAAYCKRTEEFIEALRLGADVEALKDSLGTAYETIKGKVKEFLATIPLDVLKPFRRELSVVLEPYLIPDLADLVFDYVHKPL